MTYSTVIITVIKPPRVPPQLISLCACLNKICGKWKTTICTRGKSNKFLEWQMSPNIPSCAYFIRFNFGPLVEVTQRWWDVKRLYLRCHRRHLCKYFWLKCALTRIKVLLHNRRQTRGYFICKTTASNLNEFSLQPWYRNCLYKDVWTISGTRRKWVISYWVTPTFGNVYLGQPSTSCQIIFSGCQSA